MIFQKKPEDFNPEIRVVSSFIEKNGLILLLRRQDHKPQGDTWGVPAGKIDDGENKEEAVEREIEEETGLKFPSSEFSHHGKVYVRYPSYDFVYHMFHVQMNGRDGGVKINPEEHKDYRWVKPESSLEMKLIRDLDSCIELFYDL